MLVCCCLQVPAAAAGGASTKGSSNSSGVVWVEVCKGAFLSEARPVLLVEDPALAEVRGLCVL